MNFFAGRHRYKHTEVYTFLLCQTVSLVHVLAGFKDSYSVVLYFTLSVMKTSIAVFSDLNAALFNLNDFK